MNSQPLDVQEVAFTLLAQISDSTTMDLVHVFENVDEYTTYRIPKRSRGFRIICEPNEDLKKVQHSILLWLYRIQKRTLYYQKYTQAFEGLVYKQVLKHTLDYRIHGSVKDRSVVSATKRLLTNNNFIIELDLKDAFSSIRKPVIYEMMKVILTSECESLYYTYQARREKIKEKGKLPSFFDRGENHFWMRFDRSRRDEYPRYPLFTNKRCFSFRRLIRDQVTAGTSFEASCIPDIIELFAEWFTTLVTHKGSLPQGAPTSGFLLNMVLSEKVLRTIGFNGGVYVDNFLISLMKKPNQGTLDYLVTLINGSGIVTVNPKKIKVYDVRNKSAPILGMKVVRRFARPDEIPRWHGDYPRGMKKRLQKSGAWSITHLSLPKKKQKQYRAFLHECITGTVSDETMSKAHGCMGHIVSIYGNNLAKMPASLKKVVQLFRDKHISNKVSYAT